MNISNPSARMNMKMEFVFIAEQINPNIYNYLEGYNAIYQKERW